MKFSRIAKPAPTAKPEMAVSTMKPARLVRSSQATYTALAISSITGAPDRAHVAGAIAPET